MLSYAEVFYEGARSQLLPISIVLRAVWCYLSLREGGGRNKEGEGRREGGRGPRLFQLRMLLSTVSQTELKAAPRQSPGVASVW